jgi:hypothetical protein
MPLIWIVVGPFFIDCSQNIATINGNGYNSDGITTS